MAIACPWPSYRDECLSCGRERLRNAYSDWLQSFRWDYFLTVTFADARQPHHALTTVRSVGKVLRRHEVNRWFLGTELHLSRNLHVHGLLQAPEWANPAWRDDLNRTLYKRYGRTSMPRVRSREAVSTYVTKYVTKALTEYEIHV